MSYNERLAEIIGSMDDRTYRQTAEAIRKSNIDFLDHYLRHHKTVPILSDVNVHAARKGIEQLQRELDEKSDDKRNIGRNLV